MRKPARDRFNFDYLPFVTQKRLDEIGLRNIERMLIPGEHKKELIRRYFEA